MGFLDQLMSMFGSKPQQPQQQQQQKAAPPQGGLVGGAVRDKAYRDAYLQYQLAMQENGETPMPYEQWLAAQESLLKQPAKTEAKK